MMLFNRDSAIHSASKRFYTVYKSKKSDPLQPSGRHDIPSGRPTVQSIIRLDGEIFPSRPSSMSRSFELLQLAPIWTPLSVILAMRFPSKTQIWEVRWNRLDVLIHKASIAFKIQKSGRASIRYGNCVHQINRPEDHSIGPDTRSLDMEIGCSGSATVQATGHHRPDAAQIRKEFQRNFGKPIVQLSIWTPYDCRPDGA